MVIYIQSNDILLNDIQTNISNLKIIGGKRFAVQQTNTLNITLFRTNDTTLLMNLLIISLC
jgi:hypothetical protein